MNRIWKLMKTDLPRRLEMFHRVTYLLVVLICLALVIPSLSCAPGQSSKGLELKLEKAPRLNEPVKLKCIRQTSDFFPPGREKKVSDNISQVEGEFVPPGQEKKASDKPKHEKINLTVEHLDLKTRSLKEVPLEGVMVGTSLNWEGDMTGEPMQFSATIKLPYEGCWSIFARSTYNPRDIDSVAVQVTEDASMFGCEKDYRPSGSYSFPINPSQRWPVSVELDIPKPPRLGEPAQLTWSLNSIRDIDGVISEVQFYRMEGTNWVRVPAEDMLLEGDLSWKGSLKKGNIVDFSATVKFPREGDWGISAIADSYAEQEPINASSGLFLHVEKDKSRWGWTEPHEKPFDGPPAPPENPR
jgi:hypothetical protein